MIMIMIMIIIIIIIIIIITNREIDHRRPDHDITDHVKNNNKVLIIDIAVPSDSSVEGKEREEERLDFGERRQK